MEIVNGEADLALQEQRSQAPLQENHTQTDDTARHPRIVIIAGGSLSRAAMLAMTNALVASRDGAEIVLLPDRLERSNPMLLGDYYDMPPFPKKRAPVVKELTQQDRDRISAAQAKRDRKAAKNRRDATRRVDQAEK